MKPHSVIYLFFVALLTTLTSNVGANSEFLLTPRSLLTRRQTRTVSGLTTTFRYPSYAHPVQNPDRGFYRYTEYRSSAPSRLSADYINSITKAQNITLIYHLVILDKFKTNLVLSNATMQDISANFDVVRACGLTMLLRFAYTIDYVTSPPYGDASHDVVVSHIKQLTPLISTNGDIISVLQQGFIGIWGEGYYTDYYGGPNDGYDPNTGFLKTGTTLDRRIEVMKLLLNALSVERPVATRYSGFLEQMMVGQPALNSTSALNRWMSPIASRVFMHNDCFLASTSSSSGTTFSTDFGTFNDINQWRRYAQNTAPWGPTGGETCNMNQPSTDCTYALNQLSMFNYAYMNTDFLDTVINNWKSQGCYNTIRNRLGYRLVLNQFSVSSQTDRVRIQFNGVNEGWGRIYNQKWLTVTATGTFPGNKTFCWSTFSQTDVRSWAPKGAAFNVTATVGFPFALSNANLKFQIEIKDMLTKRYQDTWGNVLFANVVPHDLKTRLNNVGSAVVNVTSAPIVSPPLYNFNCF
ncbi:hypothetical protein HDV05_003536 [Chytridiales sp. JEL 0842]|nr:hypothetical protein HDV05_003536 [Chytridiales sp. JEL 0842]